MKHDDKQAIALWRLGVLGPLTSARLKHGDRRRFFDEAASRTQERPDGTRVQVSARHRGLVLRLVRRRLPGAVS
jgi:hypothetical protein